MQGMVKGRSGDGDFGSKWVDLHPWTLRGQKRCRRCRSATAIQDLEGRDALWLGFIKRVG